MPDSLFNAMATAIFRKAIQEDRCGEVMECFFEGGSATIDAVTGDLVLVTGEQLRQMGGE